MTIIRLKYSRNVNLRNISRSGQIEASPSYCEPVMNKVFTPYRTELAMKDQWI